MMKLNQSLIALTLVLAGIVAVGASTRSLSQNGNLAPDDNPFALHQSAYGRLLARLSETTVDRVWHLGIEQIVPHYMSGEDHGDEGNTHEVAKVEKKVPQKPVIELAKAWVQKRVVSQYTRTNPYGLSEQHKTRVNRDIAKMLARSYQMDPTHYGAYNSYHLFITHQTFGGTEETRESSRALAERTIAIIEKETEDPEAYLTAASAAMNLFVLETEDARINHTPIGLDTLKKYRKQVAGFLDRFEELQVKAEEAGSWDAVSMDRQIEITQRFRFTKKTFGQFDAMIARAEKKVPSVPESEVAGLED